jgi:hypothetical protein
LQSVGVRRRSDARMSVFSVALVNVHHRVFQGKSAVFAPDLTACPRPGSERGEGEARALSEVAVLHMCWGDRIHQCCDMRFPTSFQTPNPCDSAVGSAGSNLRKSHLSFKLLWLEARFRDIAMVASDWNPLPSVWYRDIFRRGSLPTPFPILWTIRETYSVAPDRLNSSSNLYTLFGGL